MKSKDAKLFLDTWVTKVKGYSTPVVSYDDAIHSAELAEKAMKQKAIEAYKKSCDFNAPGCCGCKDKQGKCDCEQLKDFIEELNNN